MEETSVIAFYLYFLKFLLNYVKLGTQITNTCCVTNKFGGIQFFSTFYDILQLFYLILEHFVILMN